MAEQRVTYRYSEAFKRKVVAEIESGELAGAAEARRRYGIAGCGTVGAWMRRYGKDPTEGKVVRVELPEERQELERLRRQVRELESALARTRTRELLNESFFDLLCEQTGTDAEEFKKKADAKLFGEPRPDRKESGESGSGSCAR